MGLLSQWSDTLNLRCREINMLLAAAVGLSWLLASTACGSQTNPAPSPTLMQPTTLSSTGKASTTATPALTITGTASPLPITLTPTAKASSTRTVAPLHEPAASPPAPAAQGQAIFIGKGGCLVCHTIEGISAGLVGPDLTHIGTDAAERKPGVSAKDYLTESIREPETFVAEGVERAIPGIMTTAITASFIDDEVAALVEFLLAQK